MDVLGWLGRSEGKIGALPMSSLLGVVLPTLSVIGNGLVGSA